MSWVIGDSEDEGEFIIPPNPPVQTSSLSDFSPREIVLPANVSTISEFTNATSTKTADTTADTIIIPATSADLPVKPKRPRPRPAYKGAAAVADSINQSGSSASAITTAIHRTSMASLDAPLLDADFSLAIAESAKTLRRASKKNFVNLCSSDVEADSVVVSPKQASARQKMEECHRSSSALQSDAAVRSDGPLPPSSIPASSAVHVARPSSAPRPGNALPSSPFQPRKKKRKAPVDDFEFVDDSVVVRNDDTSSSVFASKEHGPISKKQRKGKEKKSRVGKGKERDVTGGDDTSREESANPKRRQTKAKEKASEQEFKSKEFIDDSEEDDLLLVPGPSKSGSRISHSDPATVEVSARRSVNVSTRPSASSPTKMVLLSPSVLPSALTSARTSAAVSDPPSVQISAPPPSPIALRPGKSKSKKSKTKNVSADRSSNPAGTNDLPDCALANLDSGDTTIAPEGRPKKSTKQSRKSKKTGPSVSKDIAEGPEDLPVHDFSDSAEQGVPVTGKSCSKEMKGKKKQRAIVSSDEEDEPVAESRTKINPAAMAMEADKTRMKERGNKMNADKENQAMSTPKDCEEKVPEPPPPPTSELDAQCRTSNPIPKQQFTTPRKLPSRRDSMSAIIRRASSKVQSPLGTPSPVHAYSPLAKASRTALSRIAPLHPNRRPPPPPPPRPPPPKKSKKMLELEEKWEMELAESVDGWSCMTDEERAALRRAKRDAELGFDD